MKLFFLDFCDKLIHHLIQTKMVQFLKCYFLENTLANPTLCNGGGFKNCVYPECHGPRVLCVCTTLFCYHTVRPLKRVPFNRSQLKWTQLAGHTIYILRRPASSPGPANCVRGAGSGRSVPCMMLAPVTNFHEFFGQIDFVLSLVCDCQWAH